MKNASVSLPTKEEVSRLAEAMWGILDDMSNGSQNASLGAKAQARVAYEPWFQRECLSEGDLYDDWMPYSEALKIVESL